MVTFNIKGIVAPVFTPIDDDGQVAYNVIAEYVQYLVNNGVEAILVGGTTGEAVSLSLSERQELLRAWLEGAKPHGVTVIAQVGGVPLPDVLTMARFAEDNHADGIMTLPELYFKPKTSERLVDYLEMVSKAAPTLPLLYYHFPMMSGVEVNVSEFFALATSRIPNFMGMKADLGIAAQVADQLEDGQKIFIANHLLAPSALLGHDSSIATVTNMFPDLVKELVKSVKTGDVARAKELQEKLNGLVKGIAAQGDFVPTMKVAMEMLTGIKVGPPRQPLCPLDLMHRSRIEVHLTQMGYRILSNKDL